MKTIFVALSVLVLASSLQARTWHVAKDGSGDFSVIQEAVDAASDGDVIWIHAGRYEEISHDFPIAGESNPFRADVHVGITKENLTLRGDGPDFTIIGAAELLPPPPTFNYFGIAATHVYASSLTIQDLRIDNVWTGVYAVNPTILIEDCEFADIVENGMLLNLQSDATVRNCDFNAIGGNGVLAADLSGLLISNCMFDDSDHGVAFVRTFDAVVESCTFVGGIVAVDVQQGSSCTVSDCQVTGDSTYGLAVLSGAYANFSNCEFNGGAVGAHIGDQQSSATGANCVFTGHTYASIEMSHGHLVLHDSDIINGGGRSVLCGGTSMDPYHIDLTNNYWGTDDASQIAEWIWDATDDPDLSCTVDYIPFQGAVATEPHSWSDVKSLFDDGEE